MVIFQLLGSDPMLIDWEWFFADSELPDMQKEIDHIKNVLGQNAEVQAQQQALANEQAMMEQLKIEKEITTPDVKPQAGGKK